MPHVDLLELPYFEGISLDAVVALVDLMEPKTFASGAVIMNEADKTPPPLYIATTGRVLICKQTAQAPPNERQLAELASPTLFGEVELFCQVPPVATVRALTAVSTFVLTRATFEQLFNARLPALMMFVFNVARVACHRLAIADDMLANSVGDEDLVKLRQTAFSRIVNGQNWYRTTGAFRRPTP